MADSGSADHESVAGLYRRLQDHLADGLVIVVGSGLSVAEGLPSMADLGKQLAARVLAGLPDDQQEDWARVANQIAEVGLEAALKGVGLTDEMEAQIRAITAEVIGSAEQEVIGSVISSGLVLRFAKLLPYLLPGPDGALTVVTTNYDRLIECAAELTGWGVDTQFRGQYVAPLVEEGRSLAEFIERPRVNRRGRCVGFSHRKRLSLFKPHGSLDWHEAGGKPARMGVPYNGTPLIITPGGKKYRLGYDSPFDVNREGANRAICRAPRLLVIGYGYNDDHLETHLAAKMRDGTPTVVLTHSLTQNAALLLRDCSDALSLSANPFDQDNGFRLQAAGQDTTYPGRPIWDVGTFAEEVLMP